jgi:hypothetical protein
MRPLVETARRVVVLTRLVARAVQRMLRRLAVPLRRCLRVVVRAWTAGALAFRWVTTPLRVVRAQVGRALGALAHAVAAAFRLLGAGLLHARAAVGRVVAAVLRPVVVLLRMVRSLAGRLAPLATLVAGARRATSAAIVRAARLATRGTRRAVALAASLVSSLLEAGAPLARVVRAARVRLRTLVAPLGAVSASAVARVRAVRAQTALAVTEQLARMRAAFRQAR